MAKRRIVEIARERGLDPNEVARVLFEAGVPIQRDMVDEVAAARALAGSKPKKAPVKKKAVASPVARKSAADAPPPDPAAAHPNAIKIEPPAPPKEKKPTTSAESGAERAPRSDAPRQARTTGGSRFAPPPPPGDAAAPFGRSRPQRGVPQGKKRRVVIDSQAARGPRERNVRGGDRGRGEEREEKVVVRPTGPVTVPSGVTVKEYAEKLGVSTAEIIKMMMGLGEFVTITQSLTDEAIELIATEFERPVTIKSAEEEIDDIVIEDDPESLLPRAPVITVMGHVDHGKTTLLDAIRSTSVVAGEAGGITQHIGAYQVKVGEREVTFLDTPGHEAFTALRARGAKLTDVAVLVVAADDSVMPQTLEAIDHAKAAGVPIVVAVNKIDKPGANPQKTRQDLVTHGLQPEDWGGDTVFVDVSAKLKTGLDSLLEMLLLQADVLELKANPNAPASGPIVESRLDVGRGPVATMLVQRGTLKPGDAVVAGDAWGKVRIMLDEHGVKMTSAGPADPVEIVGFDKPPPAGEICRVVDSERDARHLAQKRAARLRAEELSRRSQKSISLEDLFKQVSDGKVRDLNLVIKGDVQGSVEAAVSELDKIKSEEVAVRVIHTGVGGITESDVMLAAASKAIVVGFNVRPNGEAKNLAEREGVDIRTYKIIYKLTEDIEAALVGMLTPDIVEEITGGAEVRQLFKASKIGTIAGCMVTSGLITRGSNVRVIRDGIIVADTQIDTIRHLKDEVKEIKEGFECGIVLKGYSELVEGDQIEAYLSKSVERTEL
ncbi:MAG: translation initiation factor IF-2 [Thermoleophilia bacterium]|nr:translation initiation factor IF-2 [Thermoleophilia bacterium]